ncbi:hypothetical protein [Amycolatopsis sp. cmx-8-4]|uniref:hypothetical protein n=1 Tax=Amycolatopsis sp. cmx-8-4 TaxID=2790947 RepID=UPI00397C2C79
MLQSNSRHGPLIRRSRRSCDPELPYAQEWFTRTPAGGPGSTLGYDRAGRLTSFTGTGGTTSYLYGPDGLPIERTGPAGRFWFVHDNVGSTVASTNATARYIYNAYGTPTRTAVRLRRPAVLSAVSR